MWKQVRITSVAHAALMGLARREGRTLWAVVDRLLGVTAGMVEPEQAGSVAAAETFRPAPTSRRTSSKGAPVEEPTREVKGPGVLCVCGHVEGAHRVGGRPVR